jgi:hypothetical protein
VAGEDRGGDVTFPGSGGGPDRPVPSARTANAGPIAEDEVTEWFGAADAGPTDPGPDGTESAGTESAGTEPAKAVQADTDQADTDQADTDQADTGPWWPGARVTACVLLAGLVIGALGAAAVRHYTRPPPGAAEASRRAAVRDEAASWIAQQVSRDDPVSCDPAMCTVLRAHGFRARDLHVLGPTATFPASSAVVVETQVVRRLFGSSLDAAWAPAVLASFGSGAGGITVRVIAPNGAAAYQVLLRAGLAARKSAGAALLHNPRIAVPVPAAGQLTAGLVDSRLLHALTALARHQPIRIVSFGSDGPGETAGLPLRYADLAGNDPAARLTSAGYARAVRAYLNTARASFGLTPVTTVASPHGPSVLRVQVTAPSPPG